MRAGLQSRWGFSDSSPTCLCSGFRLAVRSGDFGDQAGAAPQLRGPSIKLVCDVVQRGQVIVALELSGFPNMVVVVQEI